METAYLAPAQINSGSQDRLKQIIGTLLVLAEPSSPSDLELLLGLGQGEVRDALRYLHSVLLVPDTDNDTIRIIHPSFSDFLATPCGDERICIDVTAQHSHLAFVCIRPMDDKILELADFARRALIVFLPPAVAKYAESLCV